MRSHRTQEEARSAGYPAAWHEGNAKADDAAKAVALARDVPGAVLAAYRRHKEAAEQVASTVAAIQLFRLQTRPRTVEGGAIKGEEEAEAGPAQEAASPRAEEEEAHRGGQLPGRRGH